MHSIAAHALSSLTFEQQQKESDNFYAGLLSAHDAELFLDRYGVRWVVIPDGSSALLYGLTMVERASIGPSRIYERPGARMKPYPGLKALRSAALP